MGTGPLAFRNRMPLWPLLFVLPAGFTLSYLAWFFLLLSPLQQVYAAPYLGTSFLSGSSRPMTVPVFSLVGPKRAPQLAEDRDVVPADHTGAVPFILTADARARGWTGIVRGERRLRPAAAAAFYGDQFFPGSNAWRMLLTPVFGAMLFGLGYLALRIQAGGQTAHEERHGRRTKGPELASAQSRPFSKRDDGIRFRLAGSLGRRSLTLPRRLESSHILLMGDTGSGKSNAIRQILRQVEERGETAVVYDPAGEFTQEFFRPERGDFLLNPLDARCPVWQIGSEITGPAAADAIAAAMIPEGEHGSNRFFTEAPRRVLSRLLRRQPTVPQLLEWLADPAKIDAVLEGTPAASYLDPKAGPQRAGVLASLSLIADSLELLPPFHHGDLFRTERWGFERTRWVFLTSRPSERERIVPLHAAWLDLFILRMMEPCANPAKPVWFVLDELASLNRLPQLHTAVTENRKYGNPVVLGFQGRSQLEKRYGQDAEAMLSQPATKIFFKTSEPRASEWISDSLGEIEVERLTESRTPHLFRDKKSFSLEIATKPLIMASEIAGLPPLLAYVKQENRVTPVRFAFEKKRVRQPAFVERKEPRPALQLEPEARTPEDLAPVVRQLPIVQAPEEIDSLRTSLPPERPQPLKHAFKKKTLGTDREWRPLD